MPPKLRKTARRLLKIIPKFSKDGDFRIILSHFHHFFNVHVITHRLTVRLQQTSLKLRPRPFHLSDVSVEVRRRGGPSGLAPGGRLVAGQAGVVPVGREGRLGRRDRLLVGRRGRGRGRTGRLRRRRRLLRHEALGSFETNGQAGGVFRRDRRGRFYRAQYNTFFSVFF